MKEELPDLLAVARAFDLPGEVESLEAYGSGHINGTWAVTLSGSPARRAILQRVNTVVFRDPDALMANIARVTRHLAEKLAGRADAARRCLRLIPTRDGTDFLRSPEGVFRAYPLIEGARSRDVLTSPRQAFEAARAFGTFQRLLADLPPPPLSETIPNFHDTPRRLARLKEVVAGDPQNRAAGAAPEIAFALSREPLAGSLASLLDAGVLSERVTHNDTKVNNVLFDDETGEGICVIDLDTVMPGLLLHDFGDLVRTAVSPVAEDERDLSKVVVSAEMIEALAAGYLEAVGSVLSEAERDRLVLSGKLLMYEIGLRFLTDHLEGDVYFRIHRPGHNLDRTRTQFALLRSMEDKEENLARIVERLSPARGSIGSSTAPSSG